MIKNFLFCFILFCASISSAQTLTDSNLPIVIITTDNKQDIPDEPKIGATMKIIYHPDGSRNYVADQNNPLLLNYNGRIQIEQRGSSSAGVFYKKPYGINTVKADNVSNNNVSILGMPKDNDWILNSFTYDETYMLDCLVYNLSNSIGQYACRGKHCELIVNDVYYGIYLISEKIKVGSDKVNITELTTLDNSTPEISGGYITVCDRPDLNEEAAWKYPVDMILNWVYFVHVNPKPSTVTTAQNDYIKSQFDALLDAAAKKNASIIDGYPSIIDIPSFVDFMIINELTSNVDAYQFSTYFHKDRNGKLRAGPVWDFNMSCGNDNFGARSTTTNFQVTDGDNNGAEFWRNLFNEPTFQCYFAKRWQELNAPNQPLSYDKIEHTIDSLADLLYEARTIRLGRDLTLINDLKNWFKERITWLNNNITTTSCNFPSLHPLVISKIHYNPLPSGIYTSNQLEFIELTNNSNSSIDVSGYYFRELGLTYIFPNNSTIPANGKIYLAANAAAFSAFYNYTPFGEYSRNLSNASEKLILADAFGNIVDYVEYQNASPWPTAANGVGSYLKLKGLDYDNSLASSWIASSTDAVSYEEVFIKNANTIYPNPSSNQINVSNNELISSYEIYDEVGRLMMNENNIQSRNISINLQNLAPNTYIIKTTLVNQNTLYDKVVKL